MKTIALLSFVAIGLASVLASAQVTSSQVAEYDRDRAAKIIEAFNQKPESLIAPLTAASVRLVGGVGRVDVNPKAKFSYYAQTEEATNPHSKILLIPMATSRFTPTYYQTDEWWDAHKDQKPMPRQPMEEVTAWLEEMKLTSNPDVLEIDPASGRVTRTPLQKFLLDVYLKQHVVNGKVVLFRGAEKANETQQWETGARPAGVRYWTPTANYAWRYARKNTGLVDELVRGQAPLLKFEVPVADFIAMVDRRWPQLTLGTELTKAAHRSFDQNGRFLDNIGGFSDFLGQGDYGVEFEIRSNKSGADQMQKYYKGTVSIDDLADDRIEVIKKSMRRNQKARPWETEALAKNAESRIRTLRLEARLLTMIQYKGSEAEIRRLTSELGDKREMTNVDGFYLPSWVQEKMKQGGHSDLHIGLCRKAASR